LLPNFIDSVQPTNDKQLEIKFWRYLKKQHLSYFN
jgi:hypothetical protein